MVKNMKRLMMLSVLLIPACAFADYDPFSSKQPTTVGPTVISSEAAQVASAPVVVTPAVDPSTLLDDELKRLMGELKARDHESMEPSEAVEYIATTNCVDIYYHTAEKRYEERPTKACLANKAKKEVEDGMRRNKPSPAKHIISANDKNQASPKKESSK